MIIVNNEILLSTNVSFHFMPFFRLGNFPLAKGHNRGLRSVIVVVASLYKENYFFFCIKKKRSIVRIYITA